MRFKTSLQPLKFPILPSFSYLETFYFKPGDFLWYVYNAFYKIFFTKLTYFSNLAFLTSKNHFSCNMIPLIFTKYEFLTFFLTTGQNSLCLDKILQCHTYFKISEECQPQQNQPQSSTHFKGILLATKIHQKYAFKVCGRLWLVICL